MFFVYMFLVHLPLHVYAECKDDPGATSAANAQQIAEIFFGADWKGKIERRDFEFAVPVTKQMLNSAYRLKLNNLIRDDQGCVISGVFYALGKSNTVAGEKPHVIGLFNGYDSNSKKCSSEIPKQPKSRKEKEFVPDSIFSFVEAGRCWQGPRFSDPSAPSLYRDAVP